MTEAAKRLLEEFDALHEEERAEVLTELQRRVALVLHACRILMTWSQLRIRSSSSSIGASSRADAMHVNAVLGQMLGGQTAEYIDE